MTPSRSTASFILTGVALCLASACTSTTTGADGNLAFSYFSNEQAGDFDKPIAVGAKLNVKVKQAGSQSPNTVVVDDASSDDSATLTATKLSDDTVLLEATAEGSAEISVDATLPDGSSVSDRFTMRAAVPEVIELSHLCVGNLQESTAHYLVGQKEVFLGYDMSLKNGQQVVGYGYYPLSAVPATGATLGEDNDVQDFVAMQTGDVPGDVIISSDVSDMTWTMKLIEQANIDGATLDISYSVGVDDTQNVLVIPTTQGDRVCQATVELSVETTTPELCDVGVLKGDDVQIVEALSRQKGWLEVKGKSVGDCEFVVTYPQANDGVGVDVPLKVSVENK